MNPKEIGRVAVKEPEAPKVDHPMAVMQPGEEVVAEIKRHPIGIMFVYVTVGLLLLVLMLFTLLLAPSILTNSSDSQVFSLSAVVFLLAAGVSLIFIFFVNKIYWGNKWIVTSDSITQVQQTSLFHKQTAQLSLEDLEDATAEQNGFLTHIFNYGVLKAETAGHQEKFVFSYCPDPSTYAQKILEAREKFVQHEKNSGSPPAGP